MCGGRGTRLKPATDTQPKSLLQVGDRPMIDHLIGHFLGYGCRRFVMCLGYRAEAIQAHFQARAGSSPVVLSDGAVRMAVADGVPFTVVLADTGLDTPTGGRLKCVEPYIGGDSFIVAYGDVLSDVDLTELLGFHARQRRLATVTAARPTSPFGHLVIGDDDAVSAFLEKPKLNEWVNIGFAVLERRVLDRLSVNSPQLEVGLLPEVAAEGQLSAFRHHGLFEPMDSYADYTRLNEMCRRGELDLFKGPTVTAGRR
jgi:glucose-1-phosphate cytidylyltransferase